MNGIERKLRILTDGPRDGHREPERPRAAGATRIAGGARRPERRSPHERVQRAYGRRLAARRFVGAAMDDARRGRSVDVDGARALVEDLATTVSDDPGAALSLTRVGEQDEYTSIHCVNVCVLALAFGAHQGLERRELVPLGVGALLHDLGKSRTPRDILEKPGELTPEEAAIVQRHPEDGYEIVSASPRTPPQALDVIRLHHERLGGQGYPFGLSGGGIPPHVLMTAVVDVYDTLTSNRPYRRAGPAHRALRELQLHAGANFGSRLVQDFVRCMGAFSADRIAALDSHAMAIAAAEHEHGAAAARRIRWTAAPATAGADLVQCAG